MTDKRLVEQIEKICSGQNKETIDFLETIVNKESGSFDTEDVNSLGEFLAETCRTMGAEVTVKKSEVHGNPVACTFNCSADSDEKRILLVCHRDTVFPHGTVAARPFTKDETFCYGPGCADMKGGIANGIYAIKALQKLNLEIPLEIVFTSDEEIGSEASSPFVKERARNAKAAFFLEPARANGALVTGRNGGDLIRIKASGKSSHAGNAFADGRSAIHALCAVVHEMSELSDEDAGYSTNIGIISGGEGAIIVAPSAEAKLYTRFSTLEQRKFLLDSFKSIADKYSTDGITVEISEPTGFLPFINNDINKQLFALIQEAGNDLGFAVKGMDVKGAADAGITSCEGIPTICGMGIVGGNLHTDKEFGVLSSVEERQKLLVLSIIKANDAFNR